MRRRLMLLSVALPLLILLIQPSVASAGGVWTIKTMDGKAAGTIRAVSRAGDGGPGSKVWLYGGYYGEIGHTWVEGSMAKTMWSIYGSRAWRFPSSVLKVSANRFNVMASETGVIWLRAVRDNRGPWRAQSRISGGPWKNRGTAGRACPGQYAAGAWAMYMYVAP